MPAARPCTMQFSAPRGRTGYSIRTQPPDRPWPSPPLQVKRHPSAGGTAETLKVGQTCSLPSTRIRSITESTFARRFRVGSIDRPLRLPRRRCVRRQTRARFSPFGGKFWFGLFWHLLVLDREAYYAHFDRKAAVRSSSDRGPPETAAKRFVLTSVGSIEPHGSRTAGTQKVGPLAPRLTVGTIRLIDRIGAVRCVRRRVLREPLQHSVLSRG